jgi:hypothetical protein
VAACALSASEILIVDEIGLPLANVSVNVRPSGGGMFSTMTGADGRICLNLPPGTNVEVEVPETHEGRAGDSVSTPSGQHFAAGGTGP